MRLQDLPKEKRLEVLGVKGDKISFPILTACTFCDGYTSVRYGVEDDEVIHDKELAFEVALVIYGSNIERNVNKEIVPEKCMCECDHESEVIKDDGWVKTFKCKKCGEEIGRGYK